MGEVLSIGNIYQLVAFLAIVGVQVWTQRSVGKVASGQSQLQDEIEATRVEMFHLARLSGAPILRTEGHLTGVAATIEAALKVAYLQGKADAKGSVPFPKERLASAAKKLAEFALRGPAEAPLTPTAGTIVPTDVAPQP